LVGFDEIPSRQGKALKRYIKIRQTNILGQRRRNRTSERAQVKIAFPDSLPGLSV
jgi:hypothetical protein